MRKIQILFTVLLAVCMVSCIKFKTEAEVDVEVLKDGKPQSGVNVYKFYNDLGESGTIYKSNNKGVVTSDAEGIAHFDLKSPDDMDPSDAGLSDAETFFFCTFDKEDRRNGFVAVQISTGDKKKVQIKIQDIKDGEEE